MANDLGGAGLLRIVPATAKLLLARFLFYGIARIRGFGERSVSSLRMLLEPLRSPVHDIDQGDLVSVIEFLRIPLAVAGLGFPSPRNLKIKIRVSVCGVTAKDVCSNRSLSNSRHVVAGCLVLLGFTHSSIPLEA